MPLLLGNFLDQHDVTRLEQLSSGEVCYVLDEALNGTSGFRYYADGRLIVGAETLARVRTAQAERN